MSIRVRILLLPIDKYDRRSHAEFFENTLFDEHQLKNEIPEDVTIMTLSEFMDLCNDEELNLDKYWVSYIRYTKD